MRSSFFNISNGVGQGGTFSPKLFSVYMDDLSNLLISSGVGCFLNNVCFKVRSVPEKLFSLIIEIGRQKYVQSCIFTR